MFLRCWSINRGSRQQFLSLPGSEKLIFRIYGDVRYTPTFIFVVRSRWTITGENSDQPSEVSWDELSYAATADGDMCVCVQR